MDTKSKSIKYSAWVKVLCVIISTIMITLCSVNVIRIIMPLAAFGSEGVLNKNKPDFYSMKSVLEIFDEKAVWAKEVTETDEKEIKDYYSKIKQETVDAAVKSYMAQRAQIIKSELVNIAGNYRDESFEYNAPAISAEYVSLIPDTPVEKQKYPVDKNADYYIQAVQKVLNYASGSEFNKYDVLVDRNEALSYSDGFWYHYNDYGTNTNSSSLMADNYILEEEEIRINFASDFDTQAANYTNYIVSTNSIREEELQKLTNINYYVKTGSKVFSNYNYGARKIAAPDDVPVYYLKTGGGSSACQSIDKPYYDKLFANCDEALIYCVPENEISGHDDIGMAYFAYNNANFKTDLILTVVFFALAAGAAVCLFNLAGHKNSQDGITLAFIDKLPFDIHTALSLAVTAGGIGVLIAVSELFSVYDSTSMLLIVYLILAFMWLVFVEWTASLVRIKKSGQKLYRRCIIFNIAAWLFKKIRRLLSWAKKEIREVGLKYKPQTLSKEFLLLAIVIILLNVFIFAIAGVIHDSDDYLAGAIILVSIDVIVVGFVMKYFKCFDKILTAGKNGESADLDGEKVPESLAALNDILRVNNSRVNAAVEEAVKNERTKTELITNVSHDLKTPLTSIISYVELLKGEELNNEQAKQYVEILGEKSNSLKILIENLVEASKVSAGNVKINSTVLNLKELVLQAEIEYQAEFERRNLDLRFDENCEAVYIFADGIQTYRVLENLLSNAKKYSAQGTRVYSSIRKEGGCGVFEIKNISSEPLNISARELTERFVRGDASRGREDGNGLGLSIAKELCLLQNGRLEITIDGDLFKAEVYLPLNE